MTDNNKKYIIMFLTLLPVPSFAESELAAGLINGEDSVALILTLWLGAKGTPMRLSFALLLAVYDEIFNIEFKPPPCLLT